MKVINVKNNFKIEGISLYTELSELKMLKIEDEWRKLVRVACKFYHQLEHEITFMCPSRYLLERASSRLIYLFGVADGNKVDEAGCVTREGGMH